MAAGNVARQLGEDGVEVGPLLAVAKLDAQRREPTQRSDPEVARFALGKIDRVETAGAASHAA